MENIERRVPGEIVSNAATVNARRAVKAKHLVTVPRSSDEVFTLARGWVARIPDHAIVNEKPSELIAWKTVDGSRLRHAGSVNLRSTADGATEVRIEVDYEPPDVAFGVLFDDLTLTLLGNR